MRVLEDNLAQQCLSKPLYPKTILKVTRVKEEGTIAGYTNEVKVDVDYSRVDPKLIEEAEKNSDKAINLQDELSEATN